VRWLRDELVEHMTNAVSFSRDIRPLFTTTDVEHMRRASVALDDIAYMCDPDHAESVYQKLSSKQMPRPIAARARGQMPISSSSAIGWTADSSHRSGRHGVEPQEDISTSLCDRQAASRPRATAMGNTTTEFIY
jgi:hypothetical protein